MLSLANVSGKQVAEYYEKDNYYMRENSSSEKLGEWQGKLADAYNLPADINKKDFDRLISEKDKRAGTDLTFSAPKSLSIAMHLSPELKEDIFTSHKEAVSRSLTFIEEHYAGYRQTDPHGNKVRKHSGNFLAAKFEHLTSRALDPQLHTHCVILNKTMDADGKMWALNNEEFFRNEIYLGQMYRNELARLLQEKGYEIEITDQKNGFFELKGFDQEQLEEFSKRAQEISEFVKEKNWNEKDPAARAAATILTRKAKQTCDLDLQKKAWDEQFKEAGISHNQIVRSEYKALESFKDNQDREIYVKNFFRGVDSAISRKTVAFTAEDYSKMALRQGLGHGIVQKDIDDHLNRSIIRDNIRSKELTRLQKTQYGVIKVPCTYYATKEAIKLEEDIMAKLENGKGMSSGISEKSLNTFMARLENRNITLTPGQLESLKHVTTSTDRFVAIQGHAGTGKSFLFNQIRDLYESHGVIKNQLQIHGMAFTGQAADNLSQASGINSLTIHGFLNKLEKISGSNTPGEDYATKTSWDLSRVTTDDRYTHVMIVDEASMIDNNLMYHLMQAAEKLQAKVIFSGDKNQYQAIGAGSAYTHMIEEEKIEFSEMREIIRQKEVWKVYGSGDLSKDDRQHIRNSARESKEVTGIDINIEFIKRKAPKKLQELKEKGKVILEEFKLPSEASGAGLKISGTTENSVTRNVVIHKDKHVQIAVKQAAEGNIKEAVRQLGEDIKQIKSRNKRLDRIAKLYSGQNSNNRDNSCILTASNRDKDYLNRTVREELKRSGDLPAGREFEVININSRRVKAEFSEGDKIMFLKTNNILQVKNGTRGEITELRGQLMRIKLDNGRMVNVDLEQYRNITHGYAFTSYKAQGMSIEKAFINVDTTQGSLNSRNKFYVDISRVKGSLEIYTNSKSGFYRAVATAQEKLSAELFNERVINTKQKKLNKEISPAREIDHEKYRKLYRKSVEQPKESIMKIDKLESSYKGDKRKGSEKGWLLDDEGMSKTPEKELGKIDLEEMVKNLEKAPSITKDNGIDMGGMGR